MNLQMLSYQWYKDDEKLVGEEQPQLKLSNLTLENTGNYHCQVSTQVSLRQNCTLEITILYMYCW